MSPYLYWGTASATSGLSEGRLEAGLDVLPSSQGRAEAPATRLDLTDLLLATRLHPFMHLEPPPGQLAVERQFHHSTAPECIAAAHETLIQRHNLTASGWPFQRVHSASLDVEGRNPMHCPSTQTKSSRCREHDEDSEVGLGAGSRSRHCLYSELQVWTLALRLDR